MKTCKMGKISNRLKLKIFLVGLGFMIVLGTVGASDVESLYNIQTLSGYEYARNIIIGLSTMVVSKIF